MVKERGASACSNARTGSKRFGVGLCSPRDFKPHGSRARDTPPAVLPAFGTGGHRAQQVTPPPAPTHPCLLFHTCKHLRFAVAHAAPLQTLTRLPRRHHQRPARDAHATPDRCMPFPSSSPSLMPWFVYGHFLFTRGRGAMRAFIQSPA